ncbi:MAG: hypothetical protein LBL62_06745 [Planctomycetaceae bacterium]|jgi:hypothetical protein|nr:hypothetical protein [Planctomycetaceae bacterium]
MTDQLKIKPVSYNLLYCKLFIIPISLQIIFIVFAFYCAWCDPITYYTSLLGIEVDYIVTDTGYFYEDLIGLILFFLTIHVFTKRVIQHLLPSINEDGIEVTSAFYFIIPSTILIRWEDTTSIVWQTGHWLSIVLLKSQLPDRNYFFFFLQENSITNKDEIIAFTQKLPVVSERHSKTLLEMLKFILF